QVHSARDISMTGGEECRTPTQRVTRSSYEGAGVAVGIEQTSGIGPGRAAIGAVLDDAPVEVRCLKIKGMCEMQNRSGRQRYTGRHPDVRIRDRLGGIIGVKEVRAAMREGIVRRVVTPARCADVCDHLPAACSALEVIEEQIRRRLVNRTERRIRVEPGGGLLVHLDGESGVPNLLAIKGDDL